MNLNHFETDDALVRKLVVGPHDNNCYWFACKSTGRAVLIDASSDAGKIVDAAADLEPLQILVTHGHGDHIAAADELRRLLGVPLGIHAADAAMLSAPPDFTIKDADKFQVGNAALTALHTPGHTPGGVCFSTDGLVFSGDTLFPGGPGNTWGNKDNFVQIIDSIQTKLFVMDPSTHVMPGHGLDTTIGTEIPFLDEWVVRGW